LDYSGWAIWAIRKKFAAQKNGVGQGRGGEKKKRQRGNSESVVFTTGTAAWSRGVKN